MLDPNAYLASFLPALQARFGPRLVCAGLQGSYGRGEAAETSDLDLVVILDTLGPGDLDAYDALLSALPHRELICGFLSGREELACWDRGELFQFYRDTTPLLGSLEFLAPMAGPDCARRAVHTGACALYHACVHNRLHEKDPCLLQGLYKSALFTLQAKHFADTGVYLRRHGDLLPALSGADRAIAATALELKGRTPEPGEVDTLTAPLLSWTGGLIRAFCPV